jgi:hypothetical protein
VAKRPAPQSPLTLLVQILWAFTPVPAAARARRRNRKRRAGAAPLTPPTPPDAAVDDREVQP